MNIHEYQAKGVLSRYGVPVPNGVPIFSVEEVEVAAGRFSSSVIVVKAQIHAGGRGKAGGVKLVRSASEARDVASKLLGSVLVTHQTGPEGKVVNRLYLEEGSNIKHEYYLCAVLDRENNCITFIASTEGGVDIEDVAKNTPEKIVKVHINPITGLFPYHCRELSFGLGLSGDQIKKFTKCVDGIYKAFVNTDAGMVEINPLIEADSGEFIALDAKMNFDSNALYRHPEIAELRDETEEDPAEIEASKYELNYVKLDGNIGCMVNGAGLAMSTMDIIKLHGGTPANFLDVGGGATKERVAEAFKIILSDSSVEGILVNIFGGIMRCDIIAEGVIAAAKEIGVKVPLVVRLAGTNSEEGKRLLNESGLKIEAADDLGDAAEKMVNAVKNA